jgi:hypothetical protein
VVLDFERRRLKFWNIKEVIRGQSIGCGPLQIAEDAIFEFAIVFSYNKKTQLYRSTIRIGMPDTSDLIAHLGMNA